MDMYVTENVSPLTSGQKVSVLTQNGLSGLWVIAQYI
jgi:hypothetical protein